ncbi:MAG: carbohydrate-binding domain-containing protein, partial [Candidatus Fimimonas sp.]
GKGALSVVSNSKSAIKATKEISIVDATVTVSAQNHGITGLSVIAENCTINVQNAAKDGINAECDDETTAFTLEEGYVSLKNVNYTCNVEGDGVQADTFLYVNGGTYNITTNGSFVSYSAANMQEYGLSADDFRYVKSGTTYQKVASDYRTSSSTYALVQSCKGLKVGEIEYPDENGNDVTVTEGDYSILIEGGTFVINSTDDGVHANCGDVFLRGGNLTVATLDDGLTADGDMIISGGEVNVTQSYEGIEGANVEISGGTVSVVSQDDGINAASDDATITEHIIISGGVVTVDASGDGIDSNGSILVSGGVVTVYGPTAGGNAGLDADKGIVVNGGTLFATSTLGMVETPSSNSQQFVVSFAQSTQIAAGTNLFVTDESENVLLEVVALKTCQSVIFSFSQLESGKTYNIYGGDTKLATFTVQSTITTVGTSSQSGNPGGRPGRPF